MDDHHDDLDDTNVLFEDPSGRQDALYWDHWFEVVCKKQNGRNSFEWYCNAEEVIRVLSYHLQQLHNNSIINITDPTFSESKQHETTSFIATTIKSEKYIAIHPGSGTSLLPKKLFEYFPNSQHLIVDISNVALEGLRNDDCNEEEEGICKQQTSLSYKLLDVLNPPLPFNDNEFDWWFDKGFVDAIFSKDDLITAQQQATMLWSECLRILKKETGLMFVITLAEEHSIRIIIDAWSEMNSSICSWDVCLHIWELKPISGEIPAFCFVMMKSSQQNMPNPSTAITNEVKLYWHQIDVTDSVDIHNIEMVHLFDYISNRIIISRNNYRDNICKKEKLKLSLPKTLLTIEIKPYDAETKMDELSNIIRSTDFINQASANNDIDPDGVRNNHMPIKPIWQTFTKDDIVCYHRIIPIGYGIHKLIMQCIIESDFVDELVESIAEWSFPDFPDAIQSVDVDWSQSFTIMTEDNHQSILKAALSNK